MGYEVEVKYKVADPMALMARLTSLGAVESDVAAYSDLYLAHPARDFARTHEALRLRKVGDENRITYKGPKLGGPAKTREEIELPLGAEDFDEWVTLWERLGFRRVALVVKTRKEYTIRHQGRQLIVAVDDAGELGQFAEVESLAADESDLAAAQKAVLDLAETLGLTDVEPCSYLRMTLERDASL